MTVAVYLPLLLGLPLLPVARWVARQAGPAVAARGLCAAAAVAAVCSTWSLLLLALTLLDDVPPLAALDDHAVIDLPEPVPGPVAFAAAAGLLAAAVRAGTDVHRRWSTHRQLRQAGTPHDGLVVADWDVPMAVAIPGRPGHLLLTTSLLRLLDAGERRVVLAHERSHLQHRHHVLVAVAAAAAAVNPLLAGIRDTVAFLVERCADEDAAAAVGDRELTARAVARAALAAGPATTLGVGGGSALDRVRALTRPAPAARRRRLLGLLPPLAAVLTAATAATVAFTRLAAAWL